SIISFGPKSKAGINILARFKPKVRRMVKQQIIYRSNKLDVYIKIYSSLLINRQKPYIITQKSKFSIIICKCCISILTNIKIILIPFYNLIIRAIFFPTIYTFDRLIRKLIFPKPTIMDFFRYHNFSPLLFLIKQQN